MSYLVCRSWVESSQRYLFSSIDLVPSRDHPLIQSLTHPYLADLVHSLTIFFAISVGITYPMLKLRFPNLRSLEIRGVAPAVTTSFLRDTISQPSVTHVAFFSPVPSAPYLDKLFGSRTAALPSFQWRLSRPCGTNDEAETSVSSKSFCVECLVLRDIIPQVVDQFLSSTSIRFSQLKTVRFMLGKDLGLLQQKVLLASRKTISTLQIDSDRISCKPPEGYQFPHLPSLTDVVFNRLDAHTLEPIYYFLCASFFALLHLAFLVDRWPH
ncbi:hypothetical protein C8J57DRAFT_1573580 [Mycena rebaudengoi]|nr:hypothetical protein C8J57DRAFT_1573580 [Mycena rebaudengoi]